MIAVNTLGIPKPGLNYDGVFPKIWQKAGKILRDYIMLYNVVIYHAWWHYNDKVLRLNDVHFYSLLWCISLFCNITWSFLSHALILHFDVALHNVELITHTHTWTHFLPWTLSASQTVTGVALPLSAGFTCNSALLAPGETAAPCMLMFSYCVN